MIGSIKTMDDFDFKGQSVVIRADLNVPHTKTTISDTTRIDQLLPTINELLKKNVNAIHILSHLGRPKGKNNPDFSLDFLTPYLSKKLQQPVTFIPDCLQKAPDNKGISLYENVRFYPQEEENDTQFAQKLAQHGDIFLNDAFSCAHRAHASVAAITSYLPHGVGRLMEKELHMLGTVLGQPQSPVMAIVGGSKISTKLVLLQNLTNKVDYLVIGGAMANTFLAAQDINVGASLYEADRLNQAQTILDQAAQNHCQIILPTDVLVAQDLNEINHRECSIQDIKPDEKIFDLGSQTLRHIDTILSKTKTLVWNGPVGVFEKPPFDQGTTYLAHQVAHHTSSNGLISVAGGGDTAAALNHAGVSDQLTYLSLAGGAFLEWLEGKELPGVKALEVNKPAA